MRTFQIGASRELKLGPKDNWDPSAARQEISELAGLGSENPDFELARGAFLLHDANAPDDPEGFQFPIARVVDGYLVVSPDALSEARTAQTGLELTDDVRNGTLEIIESYESKIQADEGEVSSPNILVRSEEIQDQEEITFQGDTAIQYSQVGQVNRALTQGDALLTKIKASPLFDPSAFDGEQPFAWEAIVSTNQLDAYFTHMHASSLRNFEQDAKNGVSFQHAHDTNSLPIGRSIDARYIGGGGNGMSRTVVEFYTFPGIRSKDITSDDFIRGVKAGIYRDVSVGFYGGEYMCDICGRDFMTDMSCFHFPGQMYPEDGSSKYDTKSKDVKMIRATAAIHNAHLAEVSSVYKGATPGAVITKARSMAEAGELRPEAIRELESQYRIHLPRPQMLYRGIEVAAVQPEVATSEAAQTEPLNTNDSEERNMEPNTENSAAPEVTVEIREVVPAELESARSLLISKRIRELIGQRMKDTFEVDADKATESQIVQALVDEVIALRPEAEDGRAYRSALIDEAIDAAGRAYGPDFAEKTERYRLMLAGESVESIRIFRDDWRKLGDEKFKGGRMTEDEKIEKEPAKKTSIPDRVFAS